MRLVLIAVVALAGCAYHPAYLTCKGNGTVTSNVTILAYSGEVKVKAECGEGFEYRRSRSAPKP